MTLADGRVVTARAVILATGASYRRLAAPSLDAFHGAGVFHGGPVSEAPALRGKDAISPAAETPPVRLPFTWHGTHGGSPSWCARRG